jgi:hypothetical protein
MKNIRQITITVSFLSLWIILSSWGTAGHRIINQHAPSSFPSGLIFLQASWAQILPDNASVADERKQWDNSESAKHYIDIDNYNDFLLHGKIPMSEDSVLNIYGISFVLNHGILPWATLAAFDSVKACFHRNNFDKASLFAADLGHYVADGHMPLHITKNYDGQATGQDGVHSRYESRMISSYGSSLVYTDDTAMYISNVTSYIFTYLYHNYKYIDSVLLADQHAQSLAGNTNSTEYYQELWNRSGAFTTGLFKHASYSLASLIYTAWVEAGSPDGIARLSTDPSILGQNSPNPFVNRTILSLFIKGNDDDVKLQVFDSNGRLLTTLVDGRLKKGSHQVPWDATGYPSGVYYYTLKSGDAVMTRKMILAR